MPQVADRLLLYTRFGGFEPETGLRFPVGTFMDEDFAITRASSLALVLSTALHWTRWEHRTANNEFVAGGTLDVEGLYPSSFCDFRNGVHFNLSSDGPSGSSSFFIQGMPTTARTLDVWQPAYIGVVDTMIQELIEGGLVDSDGAAIKGLRRFTASRRRNVRTAP